MTQPENQIFAFCHRMGKSRIAPSRLDCGVYVIFNVEKGRVYIGQSGLFAAQAELRDATKSARAAITKAGATS